MVVKHDGQYPTYQGDGQLGHVGDVGEDGVQLLTSGHLKLDKGWL